MTVTVFPGPLTGSIRAIASKSQAHRLLICAALADTPTRLRCETDSEDIRATVRCLIALGAKIQRKDVWLHVTPLHRDAPFLGKPCAPNCGESGSTLRFLLPVVGALGAHATFHMAGRLPERPLSPLDRELTGHGCSLTRPTKTALTSNGQLTSGAFTLPGNISSQYISGLLFALPLLKGDSNLTLTGTVESGDYIHMTRRAEAVFGVQSDATADGYRIRGGQRFQSPGTVCVEGDWSNAAFWLCAGALPGGQIACSNLNANSLQGDRLICDNLVKIGAQLTQTEDTVVVREQRRTATVIHAARIPDLVPILAAVAAVSEGETVIEQAGRLRLKESDRLQTVAHTLNALGGRVTETSDGLRIQGVTQLSGGVVDACGDHRIAMMAAIASTACGNPVAIRGAEAVNKSYPDFWNDCRQLGKIVQEENSDE